MATTAPVSPDTLITIKLQVVRSEFDIENRRIKLPLKDLGATILPDKLRSLLRVSETETIVFERFSDSAGAHIILDSQNPSIYKQLYRAAKAKLKLRIRASITSTCVLKPGSADPVAIDRLSPHAYVPPTNAEQVAEFNKLTMEELKLVCRPKARTTLPDTVSQFAVPKTVTLVPQAFVDSQDSSPTKPYAKASNTAELSKQGEENARPVKKEVVEEAPVPQAFTESSVSDAHTDRERYYDELAMMLKSPFHIPGTSFTVACNACNASIPHAHWHCSICDDGDYDLCGSCVRKGVHCGVEGHFLIKRLIENGKVIASTTETVSKKVAKVEVEKEIPGAFTFTSEVKEESPPETQEMSRTCNSCVNVFEESNFVTCTVCEDYDLCIPCHVDLKHGHHPGHKFAPVSEEKPLAAMPKMLCAPGRNMRHFAVCDGCDQFIFGVRHKCMNCPDWDYCSSCAKTSRLNHPGHRFVPIYEALANPAGRSQVQFGINCDGPLCKGKLGQGWIMGDRYKCAVCHDTDFCANCEALPTNKHNRTHPLIKFRTPVRNVSVTTLGERENGETMLTMGDKTCQTSSKATETTPAAPSANAATQVQTVAEVMPSLPAKQAPTPKDAGKKTTAFTELQAHFVRDTLPDGSKLSPGAQAQQAWMLRNPGPAVWPAGCSVKYVGGDNMLNADGTHPASVGELVKAAESNVCAHIVKAGQMASFFVTVKAPKRPGKAISYWRLKAPDGTPFGHRLWCDIDVVEQAAVVEPEVLGVKQDTSEDKAVVAENSIVSPVPTEESQMIFPTLEKESPVSSIHQEDNVTVPSSITNEDRGLLEDVESLELDADNDSTDDGFLTDEEYEILEADSDHKEAVNGKK